MPLVKWSFPLANVPTRTQRRVVDQPISSRFLSYHRQSFDFGSSIGWLGGHCLPLGNIICTGAALIGVVIFVVALDLLIFTIIYAVTFDVFTGVIERLQNVWLKLL